ncbi:hypothetical protein OA57_05565 [Chelonobacter oris]|uniref:Uncharacterized protein n=1 Tax=Chelonobacter oris TaxID=505317 RepID=A0A0A3BAI8_9PAST|nr:hypothetical protein [Chelonobacter oris]KGQ70579.1 hypothetical protein OA57_05565 [Chelonobacter oris]
MQKQLEILKKLSKCLHCCTRRKYNSAVMEFKFNPEEGWSSFSAWYIVNEKNYPPENFEGLKEHSKLLCQELHAEMQVHTGGDWRKFILMIDESGEVKTQFIYAIQSCMDEFKNN